MEIHLRAGIVDIASDQVPVAADDLLELPDDGQKHELVDGKIEASPAVNYVEGRPGRLHHATRTGYSRMTRSGVTRTMP